jgi:DNA repair exonuclease SbcCD nuclease subunit
MKLAVSSDWHGDWRTLGVGRFKELEDAVLTFVDVCISQRVEMAAFTGDLCDPDSGTSVFRCVELLQRAVLLLNRQHIRVHAVAGNHDIIEDGSGETSLTPLRAIETMSNGHFTLHERPRHVKEIIGGRVYNVLSLPYVSATAEQYSPSDEVRAVFRTPLEGPLIVFGHLMIPGVQQGEETKEMPRGRDIEFPLDAFIGHPDVVLINGHYHEQQVFIRNHPLAPIYIPGAPMRLTFGHEHHRPGFLLFEVT